MKNAFYFILKALCVLKISKFLCWFLGHVEKLDLKYKFNFKTYGTVAWFANN